MVDWKELNDLDTVDLIYIPEGPSLNTEAPEYPETPGPRSGNDNYRPAL